MKIVFVEKPSKGDTGSVYPDVVAGLVRRGATVETTVPEQRLADLASLDTSADLYVLRSRTTVGLNYAAALDVAGARLLIPYANERVLRNKVLLQQRLIVAKIPVPRSYLAWNAARLLALFDERGPLVVKPLEGHGGQGVQFVRTREELEPLGSLEGPLFVQELAENTGSDLKVYGIGEQISAIRRVFPARTPEEKLGAPADLSPEVRELAGRCDAALGLGLYGVDFIDTPAGPLVIDVNSMPGYKGVAGAAEHAAEYIYGKAGGSNTEDAR